VISPEGRVTGVALWPVHEPPAVGLLQEQLHISTRLLWESYPTLLMVTLSGDAENGAMMLFAA
jgi:hypothetical protein